MVIGHGMTSEKRVARGLRQANASVVDAHLKGTVSQRTYPPLRAESDAATMAKLLCNSKTWRNHPEPTLRMHFSTVEFQR